MKLSKFLQASLYSVLILSSAACGGHDYIHGADKAKSADAATGGGPDKDAGETGVRRDEIVRPPKEYYDSLLAQKMAALDDPALALANAAADQVLWVNFGGASLQKGFNRGQSFILCKASATIPPAEFSPAEQDQILQLVQSHYNKAGAKLIVTPNKPASGDFTTMNVGGAFSDLGCSGGGILGIAPLDEGNGDRNDIGFAFSMGESDINVIAETISHEAGHSFGLDHVENAKDLMFASSADNIEGFLASRLEGSAQIQDEPALLKQVLGVASGSQSPVPSTNTSSTTTTIGTPADSLKNLSTILASIPGLAQINNIGKLLPGLAGGNVLDISQLIPQLGGLLPGGLTASGGLPGLDKILTIIGLASGAGNGQTTVNTGSTPLKGLAGLINPILASGILGGAGGGLNIGTLASLGGFGSVSAGVGGLQGLLNGLIGGGLLGGGTTSASTKAPTTSALTILPDLSLLLGLPSGGVATGGINAGVVASLLKNLSASGAVVADNYQGPDRDALMSLLKVAYSQAYAQQMGQ